MYNSKGYARLHHLNQAQIRAIKESQLTVEPKNSTRTPYIELGRDIKTVPEQEFKTPPTGMRPPRRMETPTTPKFDPGTMNYSKSTVQGSIQQWVKEQNEIGHKTRYVPRQGFSPK